MADEAEKVSARSAVEHVFRIVKNRFGLRKTGTRGLARVARQFKAAVAVGRRPDRAARPQALRAAQLAGSGQHCPEGRG